jgi:FkbH-like protein
LNPSTLLVSGTFTVDPIALPIRSWLDWLGWNWSVQITGYNQVIQQLLDQSSAMARNVSGANLILIRAADWFSDVPSRGSPSQPVDDFLDALDSFLVRSQVPVLVVLCDSCGEDREVPQPVASFEDQLCQGLASRPAVHVLSHGEIDGLYPVTHKLDSTTLRAAHVPYTPEYYTAIASAVCRKLAAIRRPPYKVIALDCDQTLWDGVCAEDGVHGVQITPERAALQTKIRELHQQGVLICLCSKNQPDDVWAVIDQHPDMILRRQSLATERINWEPKSVNLRSMAKQLNLGLDSFVFVDDNPIECAEVKANCPQVLTVQLPPQDIARFISHCWVLDQSVVSQEDRHRSRRYAEERERQQLREQTMTLDDFLGSLELRIDLAEIQAEDLERVAQLTQRTNQMNFTTIRRTVAELTRFCRADRCGCFTVRVADRFGDYGLVGAVLYQVASRTLHVDTFLLSCRALGRRVEKQMLQHLVQLAKLQNCERIQIPFQRTEKNQPAWDLVRSLQPQSGRLAHSDGLAHTDELTQTDGLPAQALSVALSLDEFELALTRIPDLLGVDTEVMPRSDFTERSSTEGSQSLPSAARSESDRVAWIATELADVASILQRIADHAQPRPELDTSYVSPQSELQTKVAQLCCRVMNLDRIGMDDPLKSLGLSSLQVVLILGQLHSQFSTSITITELFSLPTLREICQRLARDEAQTAGDGSNQGRSLASNGRSSQRCVGSVDPQMPTERPCAAKSPSGSRSAANEFQSASPIAVVGLAGRFPGAQDVPELWQNLVQGKCSIVDIPENQLNLPIDSPLRRNPNLVKRAASIADPEYFDAKFFGIFPKEAQVMDPQHRIMIECCWHALEDAGYAPDAITVPVGLFAGCYMDTYILASLASNPQLLESLANSFHGGDLQTELGNDKDYLVTRVSYLLNLRGPAITVQTACSTSLVAIAQACQSLTLRQCDMALAGGVTLKLPQNRGYLYADGGMVSPDGVCRTFDAKARGTVFGEGAGVVVLKRLEDALADGDDVYAVIKGWGLNNDGRAKLGYTAPSAEGQFQAIAMAHQMAGITADSIGYMEAHGTGTALGDPIEVDALTRAFRLTTDEKQYCAIGSLKTNIGHLDVAAGVSGLIKVCLAMRNQMIPPSLQFDSPNPNIDFPNSPFFVNTQLRPWNRSSKVRRAGLSSFGVGGTNAHVVIEEAPDVGLFPSSRPFLLFPLSARSPSALEKVQQQLMQFLESNQDVSLEDVAFTLQTGRKKFNYTTVCLAGHRGDLISHLRDVKADSKAIRHQVRRDVPSVWMFPGQGSQFLNMGRELYETEPVFAEAMDRCFALLQPLLGFDLRQKLFVPPESAEKPEVAAVLRNTVFAQPAIFCVSYAYAQWLMACGVRPQTMIGHSLGEFVAACLGGVFSLADALKIVVGRARLMQELPEGGMLAVRTNEETVRTVLQESDRFSSLSIAAVNSPVLCVVSGPSDVIEEFQLFLEEREIASAPLHTSHAFHSSMMDPAIEPFLKIVSELKLASSQIPIVSSVTGELLTPQQACDPMYWARHLRETVRFSDAAREVIKKSPCVLMEVGPGQTLSTLARQQPGFSEGHAVVAVSPHAKQLDSSAKQLWSALGSLWQAGIAVDFAGAYRCEQRRRLHLPVYPFERQRYWFDQIAFEQPQVDPQSEFDSAEKPAAAELPLQSSGTDAVDDPTPQIASSECDTSPGTLPKGEAPNQECLGAEPFEDEIIQTIIQQQLAIMQQQLECWQQP